MRKASLLTRLRAKKRNQGMLAGITWYNAETWAQVKASATDPERFENSFPEWEAVAIKARRELQRSGVRAVEWQIIPQEFLDWCALNGKINNAAARAEFVAEQLRTSHESQSNSAI